MRLVVHEFKLRGGLLMMAFAKCPNCDVYHQYDGHDFSGMEYS